MSTPEGRVKAKVTRWLKDLGEDCWYFMPVQSGFGRPALDYECTIHGLAVAIETKAPGGEMSPTQRATRDTKLRAGGLVLMIWDDTSLNTCKEIVRGIVPWPLFGAYLSQEARDIYQEHLKVVLAGKAPKSSTGRNNGASGATPQ